MYGIPHLKLQPIQNFEKLATFFSEEVSIKNRVRDFHLKALIVIIIIIIFFSEKQYFLLYSCVIFKIFIYKMCHTVLSSSLFLFQTKTITIQNSKGSFDWSLPMRNKETKFLLGEFLYHILLCPQYVYIIQGKLKKLQLTFLAI